MTRVVMNGDSPPYGLASMKRASLQWSMRGCSQAEQRAPSPSQERHSQRRPAETATPQASGFDEYAAALAAFRRARCSAHSAGLDSSVPQGQNWKQIPVFLLFLEIVVMLDSKIESIELSPKKAHRCPAKSSRGGDTKVFWITSPIIGPATVWWVLKIWLTKSNAECTP